ncbi:hypothetical protein SELR_04830 [Selenomonas ruminantium subsp. lactilytica TAM6421]|uniref:4Fe-4S ferredoxin-type domain-containing protein n=1 Tax=Selenomonas ruminantium subsp. lactilytica (strain NBRC 103574 / TAM6421) TaxID=927704 RepID=I0GN54_SELRL|nr:4Fe-4S binding protein [Selenomonas ruminantium]BAL82191.1 hypothetical protein SELR_04830 [Selenomonas ruminantium subsp. lactilytica TAM6421]
MAKREIDLNRCLFHYTNVTCNRCESICPQKAIQNRQIDRDKCDNCGLCTAICPTGAIHSDADYDRCLTAAQNLEPQVLMCHKVSPEGMPCLGALNRRLLWALASQKPLALDISRCAECKPAVAQWLTAEIATCNEALAAAKKAPLKLVRVKAASGKTADVPRRSFFRSLFAAAKDSATEMAEAQTERQYAFDPVVWLNKQPDLEPSPLFPGLILQAGCNGCGLCTVLCPEKALTITEAEADSPKRLHFSPLKCTACGLCSGNCPQNALKLQTDFSGTNTFPLTGADSAPNQQGFHLQRG